MRGLFGGYRFYDFLVNLEFLSYETSIYLCSEYCSRDWKLFPFATSMETDQRCTLFLNDQGQVVTMYHGLEDVVMINHGNSFVSFTDHYLNMLERGKYEVKPQWGIIR